MQTMLILPKAMPLVRRTANAEEAVGISLNIYSLISRVKSLLLALKCYI